MRLFVILAALAIAGAAWAAPEAPEIAVVVDPQNQLQSLDGDDLAAIFLAQRLVWKDGSQVIAFNLPPGDPVRVAFDKAVLHFDADQAGRYWVDQRIRGGARPPRQIADPVLVARLVAKLRGGVGYVPADKVGPADRVVARVRSGKVVKP